MTAREKAWTHYFVTGDREPLIKAYWDSIRYLAGRLYISNREEAFQEGMIGLLKAINTIDPKRVKSKDSWVWWKVKREMRKFINPPVTVSLNAMIHDDTEFIDVILPTEDDDTDFDLMIRHLPARTRLILSLIYRHDWQRTEIAKLFNLSSMRVGQIEKEALEQIALA